MLIIIISTVIVLGSGLAVYFFHFKPQMDGYHAELLAVYPVKTGIPAINPELEAEAGHYATLQDTTDQVEQYVDNLPFYSPDEPGQYQSGEEIMDAFAGKLDQDSIAFAGAEQILLMAFPPEQLANCLLFATESLIGHTSQATAESLLSVKASLVEGWINVHDPQVLAECLRQFTRAVFENFQQPAAIHSLAEAIKNEHVLNILHSFLNWHSVTHGLEPAMHLNQHFNEIAHSFIHHTFHAGSEIVHHVDITLHPDPSGHFPFITLVISGVREVRLLHENKTSMENSLANVALDVTGTGVGAFVGGKTGAAIGTLILPGVGTLVGGFLGTLAGAFGGRALTDTIKHDALKQALAAYRETFEAMRRDTRATAVDCVTAIRETAAASQADFYAKAGAAPRLSPRKLELAEIVTRLTGQQQEQLNALKTRVAQLRQSAYARLSKNKLLLQALAQQLAALEKALPSEALIREDPERALKYLLSLPVLETEAYTAKLQSSVTGLRNQNAEQSSLLVLWAMNAANEYRNAVYLVMKMFREQSVVFNDCCQEWSGTLKEKEGDVIIEKEKLGLA